MTRYCSTCGCPRPADSIEPCPECKDWPFSNAPNPQHAGWLERQKPVQGELFPEQQGETPATERR